MTNSTSETIAKKYITNDRVSIGHFRKSVSVGIHDGFFLLTITVIFCLTQCVIYKYSRINDFVGAHEHNLFTN